MLIFFLVINSKKEPFSTKTLNMLETYSLASSMITIYCGIFFISDQKLSISSSTSDTNSTSTDNTTETETSTTSTTTESTET